MKILILSGLFEDNMTENIKRLPEFASKFSTALINSPIAMDFLEHAVYVNCNQERLISILRNQSDIDLKNFDAIILFTNPSYFNVSEILNIKFTNPKIMLITAFCNIKINNSVLKSKMHAAALKSDLLININSMNRLDTYVFDTQTSEQKIITDMSELADYVLCAISRF